MQKQGFTHDMSMRRTRLNTNKKPEKMSNSLGIRAILSEPPSFFEKARRTFHGQTGRMHRLLLAEFFLDGHAIAVVACNTTMRLTLILVSVIRLPLFVLY